MKVIILDTDALCVWLRVTDMDHCGPDADRWTYDRVELKIKAEIAKQTLLVLPLATIIETGNHISQHQETTSSTDDKRAYARTKKRLGPTPNRRSRLSRSTRRSRRNGGR